LKIHKIATTIKAIPRMIKVILYPQGKSSFLSLPIPNKAIPSKIAPIVVPKFIPPAKKRCAPVAGLFYC
jgi:hypothetical protein